MGAKQAQLINPLFIGHPLLFRHTLSNMDTHFKSECPCYSSFYMCVSVMPFETSWHTCSILKPIS